MADRRGTTLRTYEVQCGPREPDVYYGFNADVLGSRFKLSFGNDLGVYYTTERHLALAIEELMRYAKEQYDWKDVKVIVEISGFLISG